MITKNIVMENICLQMGQRDNDEANRYAVAHDFTMMPVRGLVCSFRRLSGYWTNHSHS